MDEKQIREIVKDTVKETVKETLIALGIDACDPMDMQRDFQFLREVRQMTEKVKGKTVLAVAGVLVAALLGVIWIGIKHAVS